MNSTFVQCFVLCALVFVGPPLFLSTNHKIAHALWIHSMVRCSIPKESFPPLWRSTEELITYKPQDVPFTKPNCVPCNLSSIAMKMKRNCVLMKNYISVVIGQRVCQFPLSRIMVSKPLHELILHSQISQGLSTAQIEHAFKLYHVYSVTGTSSSALS